MSMPKSNNSGWLITPHHQTIRCGNWVSILESHHLDPDPGSAVSEMGDASHLTSLGLCFPIHKMSTGDTVRLIDSCKG